MIPFDYHRATSVEDAVTAVADGPTPSSSPAAPTSSTT